MGREIELKFDVDFGCIRQLADAAFLAQIPPDRIEHEAVYFDTMEGDLRKRGFSLRVRRKGDRFVQTVKHKASSMAGMFDRREWEVDVADFRLDFDALVYTPMAPLLTPERRAGLVALIHTHVSRATWAVRRGKTEIEVTLDEGRIVSGERTAPIAELELELRAGGPTALFELAAEISTLIPLRLGVLSKAERGYAVALDTLGVASKKSAIHVLGTLTVAEAFALIVHSCLRHYRLNETVVLSRHDPEAVHQMRVAIRRLRSAFSFFRPAVSDEQSVALREDLRWLASRLGGLRDIDVLQERLDDVERPVLSRIAVARKRAYAEVVEGLHSVRLRSLMLDLTAWVEIGPWRSRSAAKKKLEDFAPRQLAKRWKKVKSAGDAFGTLDMEGLHELRLDVKKLRYAMDFLRDLYPETLSGGKSGSFEKALKSLQSDLGDLNDRDRAAQLALRLRIPVELAQSAKLDQQEVHHRAGVSLDRARAIPVPWR